MSDILASSSCQLHERRWSVPVFSPVSLTTTRRRPIRDDARATRPPPPPGVARLAQRSGVTTVQLPEALGARHQQTPAAGWVCPDGRVAAGQGDHAAPTCRPALLHLGPGRSRSRNLSLRYIIGDDTNYDGASDRFSACRRPA